MLHDIYAFSRILSALRVLTKMHISTGLCCQVAIGSTSSGLLASSGRNKLWLGVCRIAATLQAPPRRQADPQCNAPPKRRLDGTSNLQEKHVKEHGSCNFPRLGTGKGPTLVRNVFRGSTARLCAPASILRPCHRNHTHREHTVAALHRHARTQANTRYSSIGHSPSLRSRFPVTHRLAALYMRRVNASLRLEIRR